MEYILFTDETNQQCSKGLIPSLSWSFLLRTCFSTMAKNKPAPLLVEEGAEGHQPSKSTSVPKSQIFRYLFALDNIMLLCIIHLCIIHSSEIFQKGEAYESV
jgi:hypothetical protein